MILRAALFTLLLALAATTAQAQEEDVTGDGEQTQPPTDPEARADTLTEEARTATAAGDHRRAARLLREALSLAPGPARAFNLSLVLREAGDVVQAAETMDALLSGRYGELPDDKRARAEEIRAELSGQAATMIIRVAGSARVTLHLDDRPIADAVPGTPLRLQVNPGEHVVVARAEDRETQSHHLVAEAGRSVTLDLDLAPPERDADDPPVLPSALPEPEPTDDAGPSPWIFVAIGVGLALVAGGVALAVVLTSDDAPGAELPGGYLGRAETLFSATIP